MYTLAGWECSGYARPVHQTLEMRAVKYFFPPDSFFIVEMFIDGGAHDPEEGWDLYGGKPC